MLKQPIYLLTILAWIFVISCFYIFDFSALILKYGIVGKIFLKGFPGHILFALTICSLVLLEIDKRISMRPISWIGDITYSSYLLHFPLQLTFGLAVAYGLLEKNFYLHTSYLVLFLLVLIWLSLITYRKFEMPMQKIIREKFNPAGRTT
jgi:peptidoglycan/LPS O-acetylase OafA/YrhL